MLTLCDAVERGRLASVRRCLDAGESVRARGTLERTPLHLAAERDRLAIARLLLDHDAPVDARDYRKFTPLHRAAGAGHLALVSLLVEHGASARARNVFKSTPLHAITNGGGTAKGPERAKIIALLLDAGCPINARDSAGRTALWFAAATGTNTPSPAVQRARLAALRAMLEHGANPRLRSATNPPLTPRDAAEGLHQSRRYRIQWPEAVALLPD